MGIATASKTATNRGHFDTAFAGTEFAPHITINQNTFVWASVTEVDPQGDPISGGAHVTVQQVVPANNGEVIVRLWVDNVPNNIRAEISLFALT